MAAITTAAAGNWSATGTWTGGVIPGNGDTITLNHAVTCDDNRTVGVSPIAGAATAAILGNSSLTIATNARLTCRGDVKLNAANVQVVLNSGAAFRFDASQAGTPSTAIYVFQQTGNSFNGSGLVTNGTAISRCTVDSDNTNGGASGRFTNGNFLRAGMINCIYTDFLRIGDATHSGFSPFWTNDGDTFSMVQCILDTCGIVGSTENISAAFTCRFDHVTMKNSVGVSSIRLFSTNTKTGGLRLLTDCVLDIVADLNCKNITIGGTTQGNLFMAGYTGTVTASYDLWEGNLVRDVGPTGYDVFGNVKNDYWLKDGNIDNPHYFQFGDIPDPTCDGVIFELNGGSASNGDICTIPVPATARIYTYKNCLCLPNDPGGESGDFVSALGNANCTIVIQHNTYCTSNQVSNGAKFGETYNAHTGMCTIFKNNIAWHLTNGGHKFTNTNGAPNNNVVSPANADYNAGWNLQAGSQGKGYNTPMTGGSPGVHDIDGDPQFVDSNRDIRTWDGSLGGPSTVAHALAELGKRNDAAGYNSAYTIAALWNYVRAGFKPQKEALRNAGSDGITIGAVEMDPIVPKRGRHWTLRLKSRK